jgi:hydroxymethylpyrimidine pyrophosphatase-like HAD family hydrolase
MSGADGAKITYWWDKAVDIIPAATGKGIAVEKILSFYGFSKDEAIAFGDGENDIEMLEAVGTGIAMDNAMDSVKAIADHVCGSAAEDGVYHYCRDNKLI